MSLIMKHKPLVVYKNKCQDYSSKWEKSQRTRALTDFHQCWIYHILLWLAHSIMNFDSKGQNQPMRNLLFQMIALHWIPPIKNIKNKTYNIQFNTASFWNYLLCLVCQIIWQHTQHLILRNFIIIHY